MTEIILQPAMKAFVVYKDRILLLRESSSYESPNQGKWDVPGGRVKPGEIFYEGLLREIQEESGLAVKLGKPFSVQGWRPVIKGIEHQIIGTFVECFSNSSEVKLSEDHDGYEWVNPKDYKKYDLVGALPKAFEDYLTKNGTK